jgi:hypothetical protein
MIEFNIKSKYRTFKRKLPTSWADMTQKDKIEAVRFIVLLGIESGKSNILKKLLDLPEYVWQTMSIEDKADLLDKLSFMSLDATTVPIFQSFIHKQEEYHLPKPDFINGSAIEFILSLDYYQEYGENQDTDYLLKLVAALARERRADEKENVKFGDIRIPIHDNSDEAETRALKFKSLPNEIIISVLRYFEGVKKMIHDLGVESDLWKNPQNDGKISQSEVALYGWRTVLRNLGGSIAEYDRLCQRPFWEIFQILQEKKAANDAIEAQYKKLKNA